MFDTMHYVVKTVYYLFVVSLVAVGSLLVLSILPIPGNIDLSIVQSNSMRPELGVGSLVVIKPSLVYQTGDIILFGAEAAGQAPTTHRIVDAQTKNGEQTFLTKGDANAEKDTLPVTRREVTGKVVAHVPVAGYVLNFARTPLGFVLLVGVPALLVVAGELITLMRLFHARTRRRHGALVARVHDESPKAVGSGTGSGTGAPLAGAGWNAASRQTWSDVAPAHFEARPLVRKPLLDGVVRTGRVVTRPSYSFHDALVTGYQVVLR